MPSCPTSLHDTNAANVYSCPCGCAQFNVVNAELVCNSCSEVSAAVVPLAAGELLAEIKKDQAFYKDALQTLLEGVVPILEACAEAVPQYKFSVVQYALALRGFIAELKRKL